MTKQETRSKVLDAFKELRKMGFLARANFLCCQNCAGYDLTKRAVKLVNKGRDVKGCVFWHGRDEENYKNYGEWFLAFGQLESDIKGNIGLPSKEVGEIVVKELKKRNVNVEWNGDPNTRIKIKSD